MLKTVLGRNIRYFRKESGLSQKELATQAGFTPSYVGYLERGLKSPSVDSLEKIAGALGIDVYRLFLGEDELSTELAQLFYLTKDLEPAHTEFITTVIQAYLKVINET